MTQSLDSASLDSTSPGRRFSGSVSVVIPCYNGERWVGRSIGSALDQGTAVKEVIVIDDGSTDGSLEIIQSFGDRIIWRTGLNAGGCVGRVRNRGLELAHGEFVLFLDADDYVERDSIGEWAAQGCRADLVFGPFAYETSQRRIAGRQADTTPGTLMASAILSEWLSGWFTPPCAVLWRRLFLRGIGAWNAELPRNEDGELVMRGLLHGARVTVSNQGLGVYVQHEDAGRVSRRSGRKILESDLGCFEKLWELAVAQGQSHQRNSFAQAFYRIAYEAFANGFDDIGQTALFRARELGLKGHVGSPVHRLLSGVLGLRNKLLFTGILKGRRSTASVQ